MLDIFTRFFDAVFPPHESVLTVRLLTNETFRRLAVHQTIHEVHTLAEYSHPHIKAAITANKFHDSKKAAKLLALLFDSWYVTLPEKPTVFVPIPLSPKRQKERGYNQVDRILKSSTFTQTRQRHLLFKNTDRPPQTSLPRADRLLNVRGVFTYRPNPDIYMYSRIIVLDDVTTTGATMEEALKVLRNELGGSHEIIGVTIAH